MSCLSKYWLKEFIRFFSAIQLIILVLFIFIDYLSRMERFLKSDISMLGALHYVLLKLPFMFVQLTPAGILLATITVFGIMNRNNELLAIRSSGINAYFLIKPAVCVALFLGFIMFFLGETLIPVSMSKVFEIENNVIRKKHHMAVAKEDIWIKSENRLIHINYYDPVRKSVAGVTITSLGDHFGLESRIDAKTGVYINGEWVFEKLIEQVHAKDSTDYEVKTHEKMSIPLTFKPEDLETVAKKSEEMSFSELRKYVRKVKTEGYDATPYEVDLNGKIAFPFICIIMVLTGAATGMRSFAKRNLPVTIAIGVVIAALYWIMYGFCISLGYGGILPPMISAWMTNLFFFSMGMIYLIHTG
jgi:lipopolysaccharide export system permease protein